MKMTNSKYSCHDQINKNLVKVDFKYAFACLKRPYKGQLPVIFEK